MLNRYAYPEKMAERVREAMEELAAGYQAHQPDGCRGSFHLVYNAQASCMLAVEVVTNDYARLDAGTGRGYDGYESRNDVGRCWLSFGEQLGGM